MVRQSLKIEYIPCTLSTFIFISKCMCASSNLQLPLPVEIEVCFEVRKKKKVIHSISLFLKYLVLFWIAVMKFET